MIETSVTFKGLKVTRQWSPSYPHYPHFIHQKIQIQMGLKHDNRLLQFNQVGASIATLFQVSLVEQIGTASDIYMYGS